jgi:hypothetical protein
MATSGPSNLTGQSLWTAILTCADCGHELNRAVNVPKDQRLRVSILSAFAGGRCPNGCRPTCLDLNINTNLEWVPQPDQP